MTVEPTKTTSDIITMFGEIDRQANGSISSEYPAWTNKVHIANLHEEIHRIETAIGMSLIPQDKIYNERQKLEMLKGKIENIERSKPHLSDGERDRLHKMYKHFGAEISVLLPSRTLNLKGLLNSHKELEVMQKPCIKVPSEFMGQVLALNVPINDKKISRNQAAKVWKIIGNLLEMPTNTEHLRKDS